MISGKLYKAALKAVIKKNEEELDVYRQQGVDIQFLQEFVDNMAGQNFAIKDVDWEGNCFFQALADQLAVLNIVNQNEEPYTAENLRFFAFEYIQDHREQFEGFINTDTLFSLLQDGVAADHFAIQALANALNLTIMIHAVDGINNIGEGPINIDLGFTGGHYVGLIPINNLGIQSLVEDLEVPATPVNSPVDSNAGEEVNLSISDNQSSGTDLIVYGSNINHGLSELLSSINREPSIPAISVSPFFPLFDNLGAGNSELPYDGSFIYNPQALVRTDYNAGLQEFLANIRDCSGENGFELPVSSLCPGSRYGFSNIFSFEDMQVSLSIILLGIILALNNYGDSSSS